MIVIADASMGILVGGGHEKGGTLTSQAAAMGEGLAEKEWLSAWLDYIEDGSYERKCDQLRSMRGRRILLTTMQPKAREGKFWSVTDRKSLYDVLNRESLSSIDRKAALELRWRHPPCNGWQVPLDSSGHECRRQNNEAERK
eukprot:1790195-Amphidinium_carterae.2